MLAAAVLVTILANNFVMRRRFKPLESLTRTMERVDLAVPGTRAQPSDDEPTDVARLRETFNVMLTRLETERVAAASAVLRAQEAERARLARDLHDEVNQALAAVSMRLAATAEGAPPELAAELAETQRLATQAMHELLGLARELRPAALDDHGLVPALRTQVRMFGERWSDARALRRRRHAAAAGRVRADRRLPRRAGGAVERRAARPGQEGEGHGHGLQHRPRSRSPSPTTATASIPRA